MTDETPRVNPFDKSVSPSQWRLWERQESDRKAREQAEADAAAAKAKSDSSRNVSPVGGEDFTSVKGRPMEEILDELETGRKRKKKEEEEEED